MVKSIALNSVNDAASEKSEEIKDTLRGRVVVLIWATWCPHCTSMKGDWDKLKSDASMKSFSFIEIESANLDRLDPKLSKRLTGTKGVYFPMIKTFNNNRSKEYKGSRDFKSMKEGFTKTLSPKPKTK